ncbi:MAG: DUF4129 domain-containing protein [Rhizomicrobium sp.]
MDDSQLSAADDHAFAQAHGELLRHSDIQFAFPPMQRVLDPAWMRWLTELFKTHGTQIKWGLYAVAAAVVLYVAYSLVKQYWRPFWRKDKAEPRREWPREEPWRPTAAQARQLLAECDALAAQGDYSAAVHLLLLRSIEEIEARRPRLLRRALTSREIGALGALPESARPAFAGIVRAVERSRFAGRPITADAFARCRKDYETFAFPPAWQLAA